MAWKWWTTTVEMTIFCDVSNSLCCSSSDNCLFFIRQLPDEKQPRLFETLQKIVISTVAVHYFQVISSSTVQWDSVNE